MKKQELNYINNFLNILFGTRGKIWTPVKKGNVIGRIVTTNPEEGERYYL